MFITIGTLTALGVAAVILLGVIGFIGYSCGAHDVRERTLKNIDYRMSEVVIEYDGGFGVIQAITNFGEQLKCDVQMPHLQCRFCDTDY